MTTKTTKTTTTQPTTCRGDTSGLVFLHTHAYNPCPCSSRPSLTARRAARRAAGSHANCPVHVCAGDDVPALDGEGYYYTWTRDPNGTRVRHPNAAARHHHRTYYHASSISVVAGRRWLARHVEITPETSVCVGLP